MIDNNTILLVTPVLRADNLQSIAKNILKRFSEQNKYKPFWVICIDQYHADFSENKCNIFEEYLIENGLQYKIYYQGVQGDANCGGALMNIPLTDIYKNFTNGANPWVYILDDDNIISRNFFKFINERVSDSDEIWHMNMLDEYGSHLFCRKMDFLAGRPMATNPKCRIIHQCAVCDPSQLLIRLNKLIELGGFGTGRFYDFEFMNKFISNTQDIGSIVKTQGTLPNIRNHDFYIACYHNGLVRDDEINDTIAELADDDTNDSYIRVHTKNHNFNIELSNDDIIDILQKHLCDEKR